MLVRFRRFDFTFCRGKHENCYVFFPEVGRRACHLSSFVIPERTATRLKLLPTACLLAGRKVSPQAVPDLAEGLVFRLRQLLPTAAW